MEIVLIVCLILFVSTLVGLFVQFHDVIIDTLMNLPNPLDYLPPFFKGFIITALILAVAILYIRAMLIIQRQIR